MRRGRLPPALWVIAALAAGAALTACSGVDEEAITEVTCSPADLQNFGDVSSVVENRCGTLDCHGYYARPLRLYGQNGLRRPETPETLDGAYEDYYPGGLATTDAERSDNARSMCGLEPEKTKLARQQVEDGEDAATAAQALTIVRKARLDEKHKGGQIWVKGGRGDQCLINWITGVKTGGGIIEQAPCRELLSGLE